MTIYIYTQTVYICGTLYEPHAGKDDRSASISAPCEHGPAIYTQCVLIHTQTQNLISSAHPSHRMQDSGNSLGSQDSGNSHGPTSSCARAPLWGCSGNVACPRGKICFYSRLEICVFMVCLTASLFITIREPNRNIWLRPNAACCGSLQAFGQSCHELAVLRARIDSQDCLREWRHRCISHARLRLQVSWRRGEDPACGSDRRLESPPGRP